MTNNQTKCGIIYEKTAMHTGDNEQMINYEGPNKDSSNLLMATFKVYITILECFLY